MAQASEEGIKRRGFLGALVGASAAAAAAGAAGQAAAAESEDERVMPRYEATPHVLAYYQTNRY
jgi:hypothetical protein